MKNKNQIAMMACAILGCLLIIGMMLWAGGAFDKTEPKENLTSITDENPIQEQENFDTSIIEECWCGSFDEGTVRMLGAWWYADGVVEDEQGQLWNIEQYIEENDFLLLWIADNNTPDDVTDDIVIKVWREAY